MNYIETELTLEEYNTIMEAREEVAFDTYVEFLENYIDDINIYNEAVSSSTKSDFKKFRKEFKTELDKLKEAIKSDNKKEAKAKVKKLRSILDNIKDKVDKEPDDGIWDYIFMVVKAVGTYLITFYAVSFTGALAITGVNAKKLKVGTTSRAELRNKINSSKSINTQIDIARLVADVVAFSAQLKSILNDLSNTKQSIKYAIDVYDGDLAKLERNL